jgi:CHAT domain
MWILSTDQVVNLLRTGTPQERIAFVQSLPQNNSLGVAQAWVGSDNPGLVIVALGTLLVQYSYFTNPEWGAVLSAAVHQRACEIIAANPTNHGLMPSTLEIAARSHVKALTLLSRWDEALSAAEFYLTLHPEKELRLLRVECLINLQRIDDADEALQDDELALDMEGVRLKARVNKSKTSVTTLGSEEDRGLGNYLPAKTIGALASRPEYQKLLDGFNADYERSGHGDTESSLTIRHKIVNAKAIFVGQTPAREEIQESLADLDYSLEWAERNDDKELENEALFGIALCRSRLHEPSETADALIRLRKNLESLRHGIKDPLKRGGIFSAFPYLFNSLCERLQQADRTADLLEAIESSKSRGIADRLTAQSGEIVRDSEVYSSVARLPDLARRRGTHYLTFFVDEQCVYAVFVSKRGTLHAVEPIRIGQSELVDAARNVEPGRWDQPIPWSPGESTPDVSTRLAPLVAWLEGFLEEGIVEEGDHICYSSDDCLHNIPLQYLRFKEGVLVNWFSTSRVHSAFHLERVLGGRARKAPSSFVGFVVPLNQDCQRPDAATFLANLDEPICWLKQHLRTGHALRLGDATLDGVKREALDHKIVHFSTHGWFPESGNPFHDSHLLLSGADGLPDGDRANRGDHDGRLTPEKIFEAHLNFEGSHVSTMACVSGLAKSGIAGDSLGLDWALIEAGALSLISTHWEVSAACAALFFSKFYDKWIRERQSKASAFRNTMVELLAGDHSASSLQQWTAFSLTGDTR